MTIAKEIANTIVDPAAYADQRRVDFAFAELRRRAPFSRAEPDGYDPFWVVTKHADLLEVETKASIFENGAGPANLLPKPAVLNARRATGGEHNLIRSLVSVDGAEHKALRALTFSAFTPRSIRQSEDLVRGIANKFVDHMASIGPECNFAADIAFHYPLRVIMTLLGIPEQDEARLLQLTQQMFGKSDPEMNRSGKAVSAEESAAAMNQVVSDLEAYFDAVTRRCRANPEENINSLIANAKIDGEFLNHRQLMGYYIIAATAGHDTTANTIAAAMGVLAERPDLVARLKSDPAAMKPFIEESIRWATPVKTFMRTAVCDGDVNGKPVAKGDWLLLSYHSANRDEDMFDEPDQFRIDRERNPHISFGSGPHVCLGQHLARMEMRLLWDELLPRLTKLSLIGEIKMMQSNFVVGPKTVPIRYELI